MNMPQHWGSWGRSKSFVGMPVRYVHQMDKEAGKAGFLREGYSRELGEISADISIDALVTGKNGKTVRVIITGSQ